MRAARLRLERVRDAARDCRGCELWRNATQTVFGEGPAEADLVLVGEQPGDREDVAGKPFVGPAGRLLDKALEAAGIPRSRVYVTNAVKHFKWQPRGKARIHKKPSASEIAACRQWLDEELAIIRPRGILCLGATAAQALLGRGFRVTVERGRPVESPLAPLVMATVHPSSLLRAPTEDDRRRATERFIEDLRRFAELALESEAPRARRAAAR